MIPFNKAYISTEEHRNVAEVLESGKLSGNRKFTRKCQAFFEEKYGFAKCLMTTSCTDALEMAAILLDIGPGDEVIMPAYTFVSTANAFVLRGANIKFADSSPQNPNMDMEGIEALITDRTKAIVVVHYAGLACDMDKLMQLAGQYNLFVVEDAAQAIDSNYKGTPLGRFGQLSTFSFHETKNVTSGEGGMLNINDKKLVARAEVIWEKGTNRTAFSRGEVNKYDWLDIGSSFLASEINAAVLFGQLEKLGMIQERRKDIWTRYYVALLPLQEKGLLEVPVAPGYAAQNGHLFYIVLPDRNKREQMIRHLEDKGIKAVFHYLALHQSPYYRDKHDGRYLPNAERYTNTLLRLPLYFELTDEEVDFIAKEVKSSIMEQVSVNK